MAASSPFKEEWRLESRKVTLMVGCGVGQVGDKLGGYTAFEEFVEDLGLVALEADREGPCLSDFVFHGAEGFVECVDYEVAGSGAEGLAGSCLGSCSRERQTAPDDGGGEGMD